LLLKKVKGKVVPVHTMEAYVRGGETATFILNLGTRCVWVATSRPGHLTHR